MSEVLKIVPRSDLGKRNTRRLRNSGHLPAILYGKGKDARSVSIPADQMAATLRHGSKLVELDGCETGRALIQDMQWDTFSTHVLHVDLLRVDADERVTLTVPVELRGTAPGEREGGVLEQLLHEIEIEASVQSIIDRLDVNINTLNVNESITVADIDEIPGVKLLAADTEPIVQCMVPLEQPEEEEPGLSGIEPEVIGKKDEDEDSDN